MKKIRIRGDGDSSLLRKWLRLMKLTVFFLILGLMQVSASLYSQTARLSIDMRNVKVGDVLDQIEKQSEFRFAYSPGMIDLDRKVTVDINGRNIEETLNIIFEGTGVKHLVKDRHILLFPEEMKESDTPAEQQNKVSGKVTDTKGESLPGVSVVIKGTTTGTVTNVSGEFSLANVPQNSTLVFSFIGLKSQEVAVGNQTTLSVIMEEETFGIGDVVVTALGIKREEKALGYAVQSVKGGVLQTVKGVDLSTSLTGKVAGLRVYNSSEFFSEASISLRGGSPLLVIDGVPYKNMTLRDLPADDIETIDVLKGATASALYGSQGGSGAIMITTKRGLANNGLAVNINSGNMFIAGFIAIPELQGTFGRPFNVRADGDFEVKRDAPFSWGRPMDGTLAYQWDPKEKTMIKKPYLPVGKDNFKNFLEQGYVLNNNVSITQQGEFGSFRTSASWVKNKGIYPNSMFDKLTFSSGGDMKINKFTLSANFAYNKQTTPNKGFSGFTGYEPMIVLLVDGTVDYDVRDYKDYWIEKDKIQNSSYSVRINNPYFDRYERTHGVDRDVFNTNLTMNYDFLSWLKGMVRLGYENYSVRHQVKVSMGSYTSAGNANIAGNEVWGESLKGSFNVGLQRGYGLVGDAMVFANKTFGKFTVDGFVGLSSNFASDESIVSFTKSGLSMPGFYSLNASVGTVWTKSNIFRKQTNSAYGKFGVSYGNFIFAEGTLRNDWVSTLSKDARSYLYPSFSGSFLPSEFLKDQKWLSLWKFRGSWTMSKTPAGIYTINQVLGIANPAWGSLASASAPSVIYPSTLHPQEATTFEVGTLVSILKNRLSADFSYYDRRGKNYIVSAPVAPTSGYSNVYTNSNEIRSRRGVELTVNTVPVQKNDLKWNLSVNWSKDAEYYVRIDQKYTPNRDKPWVGVGLRTDNAISTNFLREPATGKIIFLNGTPQRSSYASLMGYGNPDWYWGMTNSVTYKNFTLGFAIDGRVGGKITSMTQMYMWASGSHPESVTEERRLDAVNPGTKNYLGDGVKVVSGTVKFDAVGNITEDTRVFAPNDINTNYSTYIQAMHNGIGWGGNVSPLDLLSGTFAKIREVSLTYAFPKDWIKKFKMKDASVSVIGQNLLLIAKDFKYSDPDGASDNFVDPSYRWLGFNLKVGF